MVINLRDTFNALDLLQEAFERTRDWDYFGPSTFRAGGFPSVNLFEKGDNIVLTAEIPGLQKEDINIEVKQDLVRLSGERKPDYQSQEVSLHRVERGFGNFDRTVKLPFNANADQVSASYEDGILTVTLPRAESDKPKRISIN